MKQLIKIKVNCCKIQADWAKRKTDLLCVGILAKEKLGKNCQKLDKALSGQISGLIKLGDFKANENDLAVIYGKTKAVAAKRIMLVGLGKKKDLTEDVARNAVASAAKKAVALKAKNVTMLIHQVMPNKIKLEKMTQIITEASYFGAYKYDEYITPKKNDKKPSDITVTIADDNDGKMAVIKKAVAVGTIIGKAQNLARTLANRPGNVINPETLAKEAKKIAKPFANLTCSVMNKQTLKAKSMGGILAVGQGSKSEPKLIVLKYIAKSAKAKKLPTIGLVGKAVTFDSGGISIKPSNGMQDMKFDKSGGIAVLAAMKAIAQLKPNVNVYGLIPAAENMPSGNSYRPGDIITTYSGKTVEIQNTDAEGRMILCDAIAYADKQGCDVIVDIATLTGACMVALGQYMAGLMGSDDELIKKLEKAAKQTGEKVWHLPSGKQYVGEMKSKIADLKNIGGRWGGACSAAAFLSQFAGKRKWAHLDIAGVDLFDTATVFAAEGSRGFGVKLLVNYVMSMAKK